VCRKQPTATRTHENFEDWPVFSEDPARRALL
jgi:hypothetical protein